MEKGLYGKYKIEKADGTEIDPKAKYFVLRYDTDPAARAALRAYACETDNMYLAECLFRELGKVDHENQKTDKLNEG